MKFAPKPEAERATPASASHGDGAAGVQMRQSLKGHNYVQQRAMISPSTAHAETTDPGAEQPQAGPEGKPKDAKVILSARKGGNPLSREFWVGLDVGHCWVDVVKGDGRKDSWGYTANDVRNFPRYEPWKTVPGRVLHPDGSRGATGTMARDIDEDQLAKAEQWGNSQGGDYNLLGLNGGHSCATFAKEFFEEATGESAPTGFLGALIANPNDLSAAMNREAEKERAKAAAEQGPATETPSADVQPGGDEGG